MRYKRRIFGNEIVDADQVIGKTLFAKKNVPIKRYPSEASPVVYTAKPGEVVGIVYSWVKGDGASIWWQFQDQNGKFYYAEQVVGRFSLDALQQQGVKTLEDLKKEQEAAQNPISTTIKDITRPIAIAIAAFFIIKAFRD
jgi:hypothetical protein